MAKNEGRGLDVVGRFKIADRQAEVDARGRDLRRLSKTHVADDRRQPIVPARVADANDCRGFEARTNVGKPVEAIVERAVVEKTIATEPGSALLASGAGAIIEQRSLHGTLVQGGAGGNKGVW